MRKFKAYSLLILSCNCLLVCSCSQAPVEPVVENPVTIEAESVQSIEITSEPSKEEQLYDKYEDIISSLEAENYDDAIKIINEKKNEAIKEKYGDIEDYLVTVELTPENFDDYFEFVAIERYNAFGEKTGSCPLGLKSKKYDEDMILYGLNDKNYCDDISVEFTYYVGGGSNTVSYSLRELLTFTRGIGASSADSITFKPTGRITGSKLTYLKKDYVDSYEMEEITNPQYFVTNAIVRYKNGQGFGFTVCPDYPY